MSKKRRKKRSVGQGTGRSHQTPLDTRQANLRRFTTKSWAVSSQVLGGRQDLSVVLDLMGFFDWLGDVNLAAIRSRLPRLPCQPGCAYCCYVGPDRPDLSAPEAFRIASFLQNTGAQQADKIAARIDEIKADALGLPREQQAKLPCLFLDQNRCLVYPVRPMRCRAQHSPDANACQQHYLGKRKTMPLIDEPALLYKSLQTGLRLGLREHGLQDDRLRLVAAIEVALGAPGSIERWLHGEHIFDRALFPDETDEAHFLARFARQAKGQAQAERRQLQKLLAIFEKTPGGWASYSTSGIAPL